MLPSRWHIGDTLVAVPAVLDEYRQDSVTDAQMACTCGHTQSRRSFCTYQLYHRTFTRFVQMVYEVLLRHSLKLAQIK